MKINDQLLSIPPYISTSWRNVLSLHAVSKNSFPILIICLNHGTTIEIPGLEQPIIDAIFEAHAKFLEQEAAIRIAKNSRPSGGLPNGFSLDQLAMSFPLRIGMGGLEGLGSILQHHPEQADSPDLPIDILNKIASLSKAAGIDDPSNLPKPEPHCNCLHCQIAKAIQGYKEEQTEIKEEEIVVDEDLSFRTWDIRQSAENLYSVSNPLDDKEQYSVFLGSPVGCTCGENHCEHIRAVLNS